LGIGTNIDLLENRVCSGHFHFYYLLLTMKELKPTTVAVFIYLQPVFATVFAIGLGKDELNLVKYCRQF
jgi:drug/metabolite transporter (DMT)-like permease